MTDTYNTSGVPVDYQDRMAKMMTGEIDKLLQKLEPTKRVKVGDLPDTPDKNTVYTLQQEWIYFNNNWVRLC